MEDDLAMVHCVSQSQAALGSLQRVYFQSCKLYSSTKHYSYALQVVQLIDSRKVTMML